MCFSCASRGCIQAYYEETIYKLLFRFLLPEKRKFALRLRDDYCSYSIALIQRFCNSSVFSTDKYSNDNYTNLSTSNTGAYNACSVFHLPLIILLSLR